MIAAGRIELGRILRPVGVHGELKLGPSPDFWPAALASRHLALEREGDLRAVSVTGSRPAGDAVVLRIEGLADRDAAEALRDARLVLAGELDVEPPGALRPFQVVGLRVRTIAGEDLGEVVDLVPMPAQDLLVVAGGGREMNIPYVAPIVRALHVEEGWIEVDPPEGLLDL